MKKVIALILTLAMLLSFAACGTPKTSDKTFTIGICQLVQHPALDAATQGFIDAVTKALGDKVKFLNQNASGEPANCATIVNGFVSQKVDLIMANATPALTAAASATKDIPILGTSITEYGTALDLKNYSGTVGGNISGTSDLADLAAQAAMIKEWFPNAKKVGVLFCSAEANSRYQVDVITKHLKDAGITVTEFAFTDSNDVGSVTQKAASQSDAIYIPTDNMAASNTEAIANIVIPAKVPVIAGEENLCQGCGVCTLSISYYDLGVTTGEMAVKILTGGADISKMAVEYAPTTKKFNADICKQLGITPVSGYTAIGQ
ncbi:MAG: ABC transporter substrate-binding protein [Bacteroidales bacterium]|nr:ABC transporter substrate-binding protein [Bacteroidales bacterium]